MAKRLEVLPSFVHTFSGRWVNPLDLKPEDVDIVDVAHHLANQCRWTGACRKFYSVAQHSVLMSFQVAPEFAWEALHHDDSEYLLQDMAKPLKNDPALGRGYRSAERRIEQVIAEVFNVPASLSPEVKDADVRMLVTEAEQIMHGREDWEDFSTDVQPYSIKISPWSPATAKKRFLARYEELAATGAI